MQVGHWMSESRGACKGGLPVVARGLWRNVTREPLWGFCGGWGCCATGSRSRTSRCIAGCSGGNVQCLKWCRQEGACTVRLNRTAVPSVALSCGVYCINSSRCDTEIAPFASQPTVQRVTPRQQATFIPVYGYQKN